MIVVDVVVVIVVDVVVIISFSSVLIVFLEFVIIFEDKFSCSVSECWVSIYELTAR